VPPGVRLLVAQQGRQEAVLDRAAEALDVHAVLRDARRGRPVHPGRVEADLSDAVHFTEIP